MPTASTCAWAVSAVPRRARSRSSRAAGAWPAQTTCRCRRASSGRPWPSAGDALAQLDALGPGLSRFLVPRGPGGSEPSSARTVVAQDVEIGERGYAALVIARRVSGDGRILLDWRAGLAPGAPLAPFLA